MSIWEPQRLLVLSLFLLLHFNWITSTKIRQLPFCENSETDNLSRSLIFISTLDGKVTALDAVHGGQKVWAANLNEGPLLSSNIHRRDLNSNGQWVRLIPSLKGALYKFDGENLEAAPFSTDQLLRSSFRYSDDLVFSGGKETRSYGVSVSTGNIIYACGFKGCNNKTDSKNYSEEEILVIQHHQLTVRAIEPRTGLERWNFSVGQHELTLTLQENTDCHESKIQPHVLDFEIRVSVPEGLIWAFSKSKQTAKLWEYRFDSPIVSVWRQDKIHEKGQSELKEINLFPKRRNERFSKSPGLYLGMHERQLYIQENPTSIQKIDYEVAESIPTYPWQPHPAIEAQNKQDDLNEMSDARRTTALSVLYSSEYINGNGFYLYSNDQIRDRDQCNGTGSNDRADVNNMNKSDGTVNNGEATVIMVMAPLSYWWKEIILIICFTVMLFNCIQKLQFSKPTVTTTYPVIHEVIRVVDSKEEINESSQENATPPFTSRYLTDFEQVDCLGRGGYGVVFEAKNKIDDCNYAIKRIALQSCQKSRDRVMREVKALAKLDHHNIVRYFNAWLEHPPAGWQETQDQLWLQNRKRRSSDGQSELSYMESEVHTDAPTSDPPSMNRLCDALVVNGKEDDDSFIVFEAPSGSAEVPHGRTDDEGTQNSEFTDSYECDQEEETDESIVFKNSKSAITEEKSQISQNTKSKGANENESKQIMYLYIQMQLCQRRSLKDWLKMHSSQRNINLVINVFQQIVDAVEYVHLQGLIHRDLKPSNIFFAYDEKIKIGDFGLVTAMTEGYDGVHTPCEENGPKTVYKTAHTAHVGTHLYMSPEQTKGQIYNYKVDIYSLGIILFELLIPFGTQMERCTALTNLRNSEFPHKFAEQFPNEYALLSMMLDDNPQKRPTTLGIKARPPFLKNTEDSRWHFELPQITRHPSI